MPTRKYLDQDRTVINPEWLLEREAALEEIAQDPIGYGVPAESVDRYLPTIDGKAITADGAWVLVVSEPHTELMDRFRVPILSMWRARPHQISSSPIKCSVDGHTVTLRPQQAVIATPGGDLHLWPNEYVLASDPRALACDPDATINSLGGQAAIDPEQLFYLLSRGIDKATATEMLFDQIQGNDFCYVTFPEEVTSALLPSR